MKHLRPNLIGLVDAFAIDERFLTNGLASGNPYEVNNIVNVELFKISKIM